jgi:hypothetical protein
MVARGQTTFCLFASKAAIRLMISCSNGIIIATF